MSGNLEGIGCMNEEQKIYVTQSIEKEGFDYCFESYSDFKNINDKKFHQLRKDYLNAKDALYNYVNDGIDVTDFDY